jgi:hypothetical protein
MDPLSITTSAFAVVGSILQVSKILNTFINNADIINDTLRDLSVELDTLQNLIDNVNTCFQMPAFVNGVKALEEGSKCNITHSLNTAMQHCARSINKLGQILSSFDPAKNTNMIKKGIAQYRFDAHADEIARILQQLQSYKGCIQLSLASIHV